MKKFLIKTKLILLSIILFSHQSNQPLEILRPIAGPLLRNILDNNKKIVNKNLKPVTSNDEGFESIIVEDNVKDTLKIIKEFLNNPEKFNALGAKVPKGILFYGPPGTGKTSLGRALAKEAKCKFIYLSGSEIDDMWVGTGAAKIKDVFDQARSSAPAIIFIDEIDTVAKKRSSLETRFHTQTIQQLLVEMDGFHKQNLPIIVIGTTNKINHLDPALLRSGRFDIHLEIGIPSEKNRRLILDKYLSKVKLAKTVTPQELDKLCEKMHEFSGADIQNLVNKATLKSAISNKSQVELSDLKQSLEELISQKDH